MNRFVLLLVVLLGSSSLWAQDNQLVTVEVINGDTFMVYTFPDYVYKEKKDEEYRKRYLKLIRDVKKTLPYAKMAAFRLQMMEQNLQLLPNEKARKKYIKQTEKAIKKEFMDDLKNLTISQGKLLIRLIHRETGNTTYSLLKDYRGSATVFFWQSLAKVFGTDLRNEYDPIQDHQIELVIKSLGLE